MSRAELWGYNNYGSGTDREGRKNVVLNTLPSAYYFVYEHLDVIKSWEKFIQSPNYRASERYKVGLLTSFNSHHNPVYRYMGDCVNGGIDSLPEIEKYRSLFKATRNGYAGLDRKSVRYVFVGEGALAGEDPERIITLEEVQGWMVTHSSNPDGLIGNVSNDGVRNKTEITDIHDGLDLVRYFRLNGVNDRDSMWVDKGSQALFNRFPAEVLKLAVYKLACGMGVIDQVFKESANLEIAVPTDYHPSNDSDNPQEFPSLQELWNQAHCLVETLADSHDVLLEGLTPSF